MRRILPLTLVALACLTAMVKASPPRVATFRVEITPPDGSPLCGGWIKPLEGVDDPLWAKGIVLDDGAQKYVLCALDWCEVRDSAHDRLREALAQAVGTQARLTAVQSLHQHNAPIVDIDAERLIAAQPKPLRSVDVGHFEQVVEQLRKAAADANSRLAPFDAVATGTTVVEEVASSRRIRDADGKLTVRYSSAADPKLRALPLGLIDPLLRTVSLLQGEKPLVRLHYYATHPQSYYGDGRASSEFPGLARERLEREEGVFQIYFTGCAGNVAAGKYNDGTPLARVQLTERMYQAMKRSSAASSHRPVGTIAWRTTELLLSIRNDAGYSEAEGRAAIANPDAPATQRLNAALQLAYRERIDRPFELTCLELGDVRCLHLPGEPFIEFQLLAQKLATDKFVCVAGYADGAPGYLCTAAAYGEGGYEPTASLVTPASEALINAAIGRLLSPK
ncbi:MAG: hypothetical protein JNG90_04555 [Planctomycetaceae bacterium]|nr:hypothetical protein [Planctomycetaceae bacterium]